MHDGGTPVDGQWHPVEMSNPPRMSRRTRQSVVAYRYMLWESDEAPEALWVNALAQVRLPIVAITSSGGRSLHALVRVNARGYEEWTAMRNAAKAVMTKLESAATATETTRSSFGRPAMRMTRARHMGSASPVH